MFLNWQVTSDVTFAARYGIFFPNGDAFSKDQARQFLEARRVPPDDIKTMDKERSDPRTPASNALIPFCERRL